MWSVVSVLAMSVPAAAQDALREADVVSRVMESSPSLRAAFADRAAARAALRASESERVAVYTMSVDGSHTERITNTAAGVAATTEDRLALTTGLAYTTEWGLGIAFDVAAGVASREVNRDPSTTLLFRIGPSYDATATLALTQPLLRGAGEDSVLAASRGAEASRTAAERTAESDASALLRDALVAHWELWYATRALAVEESALELGVRQVAEAELRASELGSITRVEVLRLSSDLANVRRAVAAAEATRERQAITLARLLGAGSDVASTLTATADTPIAVAPPALPELVEAAHELSPAIRALEAQREAARISRDRAADDAEVRLDLTGSVAAGVLFTDATLSTFNLPNGRPAVVAMIGLEMEVPLGPSAADGSLDQAEAELSAAEARLEAGTREVEAEIATRRAEVIAAMRDVELAAEVVAVAHELAEAERGGFELGTSNAYAVVEAQQSEREAELEHLRAIADYATANLRLEHATARLLDRLAVSLDEDAS